MKKPIYLKLLTVYLLFGMLGFIAVSAITSHYILQKIKEDEIPKLRSAAYLIASNDAAKYFSSDSSPLKDLEERLKTMGKYLDAEIWILGKNKEVFAKSNGETDPSHTKKIEEFKISDFVNNDYMIGTFYGHFSKNHLSLYTRIPNFNGSTNEIGGYVLIHKPLSTLTDFPNSILKIVYSTLVILFLCAFILFTFTIIRPIKKITKAANDYASGKFEHAIDIHTNDEIGYLAAALTYMAHELNTLEDDQRKFVSNVSHDFRSPLTSIKGYVEAMLDGTIPPENQEKYLNIILFETERLNKLTSSLLELNKFGKRGVMLDIAKFDINNMIKLTVQTFEGICKDKRIFFELILTGQTLFALADMSKIQRVIYNLIDNAIKFSPSDSAITVETTVKNEKIFVSVKDKGVGIPKESIGKIWERFYKTDPSRGKDKKGTGLGLAIAKEIIQAHKENINVISTEGVGTNFIFSLPLYVSEGE